MMVVNDFTKLLSGGHPNSLGNTEEVVAIILQDLSKAASLYDLYRSDDEVVRLRVSSCFKRIFIQSPSVFDSYIDRFLSEVANINQASAKWTVAKIVGDGLKRLTKTQEVKAKSVLLGFLENQDDWIVLNLSLITLSKLYLKSKKKDDWLKLKITPLLKKLSKDNRASVKKNAIKTIAEFSVDLN